MELLIKNAEVITMDDEKPNISGASIWVSGDTITYVGSKQQDETKADKVIDACGGIVMPGLVNAHTHMAMTLFRGYADDMPLDKWLFEKIFPAEDRLDDDAVYYATQLACAEMIKSGTTTFADMYFFCDSAARATVKSGMNANIARSISSAGEGYKYRLDEAKSLFNDFNGANNGAVKIDFSVHAIYSCTRETVRETAKTAARLGAGMQIHLSETMKENRECYSEFGKSPTEKMRDWGVFSNLTNAAHCVYLSENDMNILKENGVSVSHNPTSNLKLASGVANIKEMLDKGINIALGTDGAASNNSLNMFSEMKLAALLQKGMRLEPTLISAKQALAMATVGGAAALSRPKRGQIKEGCYADIIILDENAPSLFPVINPVSLAVYSANGSEVKTSIINGKIVMENRELKTIDIAEVKAKTLEAVKKMGIV